jgi:hypothetical protein
VEKALRPDPVIEPFTISISQEAIDPPRPSAGDVREFLNGLGRSSAA